jgi:hypothetical protein
MDRPLWQIALALAGDGVQRGGAAAIAFGDPQLAPLASRSWRRRA